MKYFKRLGIFCLLVAVSVAALNGCGRKKKTAYQQYVQNLLEVNYLGKYTNYMKDNGGNESEAINMHQDCISALANQLITHYNLDNNNSVNVNQVFTKLSDNIYSKVKYDVSESYRDNGEYYVDVTIYPIDLLNQSYDEIMDYIDKFNSDVESGLYNDVTRQDYEEKFALGIADILKSNADAITYKDPVVVKALITDDGEYYSIDSDSLIEIDSHVIATEDLPEKDSSDQK